MNLSMRGSGAVNARYAAKIASGEIEPDNAQADVVEELAQLDQALTQHQLARKSSGLSRRPSGQRALHLWRGRPRQDNADGSLLLGLCGLVQASRSLSRVHGRSARAYPCAARRLFELGVVVVATSNLPPRELYREGLNRDLFLPFIALIEEHMKVVRLAARTDFRLEKLGGAPVWHVPANAASARALDTIWARLTAGQSAQERHLIVKGRAIRVPKAADGVARFSFHDLCEEPLAAGDYLKIAHEFHTVLIDAIPVMDYAHRNEAKRFIILIDTFYDNAVKLVTSAAAEPVALYTANDGYEAYEFKRTASRLIEMRSPSYLSLPHGPSSAAQANSVAGLVET